MTAALGLLEEGGLAAVTMRALGKRLQVNPMAARVIVDSMQLHSTTVASDPA